MKNTKKIITYLALSLSLPVVAQYNAGASGLQSGNYWHGKERVLRYTPDGEDFVIVNGDKKFNRALYGSNTAFRVEAGDKPEFALYMPNMGGNMQLGLISGEKSVWLNDFQFTEFRYRAGSAVYTLKDPSIGNGEIKITLLAMNDADGMIFKVETKNIPENKYELFITYGGANNKRFSRNGDLGVDPVDCFDLKPDYCINNHFKINNSGEFSLYYGASKEEIGHALSSKLEKDDNPKRKVRLIHGVYPQNAQFKQVSPYVVTTPQDMWNSSPEENKPLLASKISLKNGMYFSLCEGQNFPALSYEQLPQVFEKSDNYREKIASTIKINTPDPYFNTLGGAISIAADGIWDNNVWQHGAIGWRMPLNGWRAGYVGDVLGWNDRARVHFDGYAASQITAVEPTIPHPAQDTERSNARSLKKWGTQMYSNGYICRNPYKTNIMHHYDMNLCYIDELLWHLNWTGDIEYAEKIWHVIENHLAWEKRNFDPDNDGLYDAYCCIWASDALYYNSGGVTHSTAYNYRANKQAAMIAELLGKDSAPYKAEAAKILDAINNNLWIPSLGRWAEFKDFMGKKRVHHKPAVWTIYHAIDSDIHDSFQAYQASDYINKEIPHIPVRARGLKDEGYATVSTTNWFPYAWSINNVAHAEVAHTALSYWQAGRNEHGYKLLKSMILDGMYLGACPGNLGQISFYDAARGECYRDFGDPIGIISRTLIQGLFGFIPDLLNDKMTIKPGFPQEWDYAAITTPYLSFDFKRENNSKIDNYKIVLNDYNGLSFNEENLNTVISKRNRAALTLSVKAYHDKIESVIVNGQKAEWSIDENSIDNPQINIAMPKGNQFDITINWSGKALSGLSYAEKSAKNTQITVKPELNSASLVSVYDPQTVFSKTKQSGRQITASVSGEPGHRVSFVKIKQGDMTWWEPVNIEIDCDKIIPESYNVLGDINDKSYFHDKTLETVNIDTHFNSSVCDIFRNRYDSPRSPFTTLQIPLQGIGEWCHPDKTADINEEGILRLAEDGIFTTPFGLPFRVAGGKNIVYTSLWDRYPDTVEIPLKGNAEKAYLLMAGSTNHMQCHMVNAVVTIKYTDGTEENLELINPTTWYPIEQDMFFDDAAYKSDYPRPYRVMLKTGEVTRTPQDVYKYKSSQDRDIPGGAAMILDIPLDKKKPLKSISLTTEANDIVTGIMGITLQK